MVEQSIKEGMKHIPSMELLSHRCGFYSDLFITFDRSNWRIIIRDAMDGTHTKML